MSFVSFFGSRAMTLSPAFIQTVQKTAVETGCASIKLNGHKYLVSHIQSLGGFCVQSAGKGGFFGCLLGNHRGLEGRISALELALNKNQDPIKAHNEHINKIFESSI
ncbi:hypothetical protein EHD93_24355 [Escherichia coli]|uniref:hypothetical protein n=1 Tax=Escherichia coli TaxID=562 RepID=UPI0003BF5B2D|nr:hypothetical protein [Escherichia coli]EEV9325452.1 hypothetical protein [Escherichia coli]EGO0651646.1 hypothetical protein [Escherichia coli]EHX8938514.1 hypothetical protein [Escherichia coli]EIG0988941.1 hypothetical protein [Escherichia coli]EKD3396693.1 hypothetical protein [Escherichia coli]